MVCNFTAVFFREIRCSDMGYSFSIDNLNVKERENNNSIQWNLRVTAIWIKSPNPVALYSIEVYFSTAAPYIRPL